MGIGLCLPEWPYGDVRRGDGDGRVGGWRRALGGARRGRVLPARHLGRRRVLSLPHRYGRRPAAGHRDRVRRSPLIVTRTPPDLTRVNPGAICVTARGYHEAMTASLFNDAANT